MLRFYRLLRTWETLSTICCEHLPAEGTPNGHKVKLPSFWRARNTLTANASTMPSSSIIIVIFIMIYPIVILVILATHCHPRQGQHHLLHHHHHRPHHHAHLWSLRSSSFSESSSPSSSLLIIVILSMLYVFIFTTTIQYRHHRNNHPHHNQSSSPLSSCILICVIFCMIIISHIYLAHPRSEARFKGAFWSDASSRVRKRGPHRLLGTPRTDQWCQGQLATPRRWIFRMYAAFRTRCWQNWIDPENEWIPICL